MAKSGKISNGVVALSSAAILAIYAAGFERTSPAAAKFVRQDLSRRATTSTLGTGRMEKPTDAISAIEMLPGVRSAPMKRNTTISPPVSQKKPIVPAAQELPVTAPPPVQEAVVTPAPDSEKASPAPEAATAATPQAVAEPQTYFRDGTYTGWGYSRHGDIQASIVIKNDRIVSAAIEQCLTRYSCSWIEELPGQAVSRNTCDVDMISGATQSSEAFSDAVLEALTKAKK